MNLVGKIFIISIAVMSLVFMSFALAVYATHKNWRDAISNPDTGFAKELKIQQDQQEGTDRDSWLASFTTSRPRSKRRPRP